MLSRIRERKLVQWVVAYVVGAFVVLQGLELVTEAFSGFAIVLQTVLVLAVLGLPVVIVLAWFHGEKGRQRVSLAEAIILGVVVLGAGALIFQLDVYGSGPSEPELAPIDSALDSNRYAVVPFRRDSGVTVDLNEGVLIHDALARWRGIELADFGRLQDALAVDSLSHRAPDRRRAAAEVGAGRYLSGTISALGDRTRLHAGLFATRTGSQLADVTLHLDPSGALTEEMADRIVSALLFPQPGTADLDDEVSGTRSVPAQRAYLRARGSLREGDLSTADSLLAVALRFDPGFARALLWKSQIEVWAGRSPQELPSQIEAAAARPGLLTERERLMADALLHLARGQYAESCEAYDSLRRRDERDFVAWYGLGECRAEDDIVIRYPESPSGWAFRSSYHQAARAYRRAFQLLPSKDVGISSGMFKWVGRERLKISTSDVRRGRALSPDTLALLARPAWMNDTLTFVPYPAADVAAGRPETRPASHWTAVERQRRLYNEIAESWAARFPDDPEALEALAYTQEFLGFPRALRTLDAARTLTDDPARSVMMAAEKVKLLVKFGSVNDYARIPALADTVLASGLAVTPDEMETFAVVAALAGHADRAARLAREAATPVEWIVRLPVAIRSPASALEVYAALGAPVDSMVAIEALVEAALENRLPPDNRPLVRSILLSRAASLAYPTHTLGSFAELAERAGYPVLRAQAAHARGDTAEALQILTDNRRARQRSNLRRAEISYDAIYPEARLWAELGDTATAVVVLDGTLNTLRWSEPGSLADVARAASLVRAMAFRAELAASTGDASTARRWATAVAALWARADEPLQHVVGRMERINASGGNSATPSPLDGGNP